MWASFFVFASVLLSFFGSVVQGDNEPTPIVMWHGMGKVLRFTFNDYARKHYGPGGRGQG